MNNPNHKIDIIDGMSDVNNYRIGNLIYYHFNHQTSFNDAVPVKCIARIMNLTSDGKPGMLAIAGPNEFTVEIEAVEDHIECIKISEIEGLKRLLIQHNPYPSLDLSSSDTLHVVQNLCLDDLGVRLNDSFIAQTDMWNRYIYYEQE
ncbi:hypothetical protein LZG74_11995 [Dyadobacter sp. CY327]|uniref:hypothetical protein n=1 Tax=Dyadobacter sp. CY327 TaxID=2907301 RepID=UPI001F1A618B|nr:hypothetical protein [Dyadobacter sp. CY327]MCE7071030.1 hypothetical protein [Dyadobacter sp. CY327]